MDSFLADRDEFVAFYRANSRWLLMFFTRSTFDAQAALDLTAETFAEAFASRNTFRGESSAEAGAWLRTISRRQLARYFKKGVADDRVRRRLRVAAVALSDVDVGRIEELAELEPVRDELRQRLLELSERQRNALWLRVVEEQPYAEVAARLGISEATARTRVSRALKALQEPMTAISRPEGT